MSLRTRIKLRIFNLVDKLVSFLFRIKILKINKKNRDNVLKEIRNKESGFVGGGNEFQLREIRVELINGCNTKCIMCPREDQNRKAGKMNINLYKRLIKDAYDLGARALFPYHMGESLILKDFCEYIRIAKNMGYTDIMLTTTGGLIKQYDLRELVSCGLTILNFSIDAVTQSSYEKIRTNMRLKDIEDSVIKIIEIKNKLNPDLKVCVKFMDYKGINQGEWPAFKKKWGGLADIVYHTIIHDWGNRTNLGADNKLAPDDYCRYLRQKLIFGWDGTAMFCCMDYDNQLPVGKYPQQSLYEIIHSPVLLKARKMHSEGRLSDHPMCGQCYMTMDEAVINYYKKRYRGKFTELTDKIRGKTNENI